MVGVVRKVIGNANERALKKLRPLADAVNEHSEAVAALSDAELRAETDRFRARLRDGEALDDLLPEAFAVAREAIARDTGERAYDVQVLGAVALHQGMVAEMATGEGKTLVATLALYLNALEGEGAHIITVNDYLARRDTQWYGPALYNLGLTLGVLQHDQAYVYTDERVSEQRGMEHLLPVSRREAYAADLTYGTNNEFGFDYLRDNMAQTLEQRSQRSLRYAIVDEADSVLIDEARTPLIISGPEEQDTSIYPRFARLVPSLQRERDYTIDERSRSVHLTEDGIEALERGAGRGEHLLAGELPPHPLHGGGAEGGARLPAGPRLRGEGRPRGDRGRLHRAADGGPAVVGRSAPGGGGEGRAEGPAGVDHLRHDHASELLPHVRQARRHDRHRGHRGGGAARDLRAGRARDAHQRAGGPRRHAGLRLPHGGGEVPRGDRRHRGEARGGTAGAGGHGGDRELRAALGAAGASRRRARGAERQAARARGHDRGARG